jgi:hypothetical protein
VSAAECCDGLECTVKRLVMELVDGEFCC